MFENIEKKNNLSKNIYRIIFIEVNIFYRLKYFRMMILLRIVKEIYFP